jgi:putative ABC transport system permease protein
MAIRSTCDLDLLAGKGFSPVPSQNRRKVLLNLKSTNELGFKTPEEAIGSFIYKTNRDTMPIVIIGVLADFHNEGLQKPIYPMIYNNGHPFEFGYYSIKLNTPDFNKAVERLKIIWANNYPADPMDYFFADEYFFRQYQSETRFGKFYTLLTLLSISIACLGIYGLILFYLGQKRNEIGIRKINGARVAEVMIMLNKEFVRWVIIAFVISMPCAWYIMHKWLQNFAYKTDLSWWVFALAGLFALVITLLTVSWQVWKAATRNPVEALRYE